MSRVSRKWVLVLLVLLVWVAGEVGLEALKDKGPTTQGLNPVKNKFTATANPGPGFVSQATSGPPLRVNSTEVVANLNADQLDGQHSAAFAAAVHGHNVADISGAATLGGNSFAGDQTVSGNVTATAFVGDGSGLTNIPSSQVTGPNPLQIALLRWYEASQNGASFAVGSLPRGVTFDGANIWVANRSSNTVTKLRASDGAVLGAFAVGSAPFGVAFDGANIWVANVNGNNVTKLRASDGTSLGVFGVGITPQGVAFDGANVWVTNGGDGTVTKLRASDGANLGTFAVGSVPVGVAFDGANIWVANIGSNNVTKLRASDGANLGTFAVGINPRGVAFDGANIWVTNQGSNTVSKL